MSRPALVRLYREDLQIGTPLKFPIFDDHHALLVGERQVLQNEQQLDSLLEIDVYRPENWRTAQTHHHDPHHPENPSHFAQLQLPPGTPLHLLRSNDGGEGFATGKLIGWQENASIIVGMPTAMPVHVGTPLEVKLLAGKGIVSFQTAVLASNQTPYPHLHLAYPSQLSTHKLRKNLRVTVAIPAQASSNHDSLSHDAALINLSICGGTLELPLYFAQIGDEMLLLFSLPADGELETLALHAVVRNMHTSGGDIPQMRYGLEFIKPTAEERAVIEHYIFQALLEH